jgi:hypothetical protein
MQHKLVVELDKKDEDMLLTYAIERVINSAITACDWASHRAPPDSHVGECASAASEDLEESKQLVVRLWDMARDAVFRERNQMEKQDLVPWTQKVDLLKRSCARKGVPVTLEMLVNLAKTHQMTDAEILEQKKSWIRAMAPIGDPRLD